jgi:hypothetical protein
VLLTDSTLFRADVAARDIPAALLERHDALASLGVTELACAEPIAAGQGRVGGVELDEEGGRIFVRAFVAEGARPCVALAGGMFLVRRSHLASLGAIRKVEHPFELRCEVVRLSHRLHREGARLGVAVALAAADRRWNVAGPVRHASLRAVEADLALGRWGQRSPAARPMKAAVTPEVWASIRPGLELLCDSRK